MKKNITPVMHELFNDKDLKEFKDKIGIFDREFCSFMKDNKYYAHLAED